jgi:hypothetical protein
MSALIEKYYVSVKAILATNIYASIILVYAIVFG